MSIKTGIITISDRSSAGERPDKSGPIIAEIISNQRWTIIKTIIIPDDKETIKNTLRAWIDEDKIDLILTTGGTGFAPRDNTPEATIEVIDKNAPGIAEAMRLASLKITPHAMLSRAVAGIRNESLIINLPGSPKAVKENLEVVLPVIPHAIQLLKNNPDAESGHLLTK